MSQILALGVCLSLLIYIIIDLKSYFEGGGKHMVRASGLTFHLQKINAVDPNMTGNTLRRKMDGARVGSKNYQA